MAMLSDPDINNFFANEWARLMVNAWEELVPFACAGEAMTTGGNHHLTQAFSGRNNENFGSLRSREKRFTFKTCVPEGERN